MVSVGFTGGWTEAKAAGKGREAQRVEVFEKILSGVKIRTCRVDSPHWRKVEVGAMLNHFWGLRQRDCQRILDIPLLRKYPLSLVPYEQEILQDSGEALTLDTVGIVLLKDRHVRTLSTNQAEGFALEDGFGSFNHMCLYFKQGIIDETIYQALEWR